MEEASARSAREEGKWQSAREEREWRRARWSENDARVASAEDASSAGGRRRRRDRRARNEKMQVAPHLIIRSRNWRAIMLSRRALCVIVDKEDDPDTEGEVALEESSF